MVAVAQLVESRIVIPVVVGSSPISHPKSHRYFSLFSPYNCAPPPNNGSFGLAGTPVQTVLKLASASGHHLLHKPVRPAKLRSLIVCLLEGTAWSDGRVMEFSVIRIMYIM